MTMTAQWMKPIRARDPKTIIDSSDDFCWTPFHRDYAQIVHSDFFKRLAGKTQVHCLPSNDHIRTRLTHSVEVAQIGRQLSRFLCKSMHKKGFFNDDKIYFLEFSQKTEELTAAACLLHDVGHPPFGHQGAHMLDSLAKRFSEEFDDNKQVFRIALSKVWEEKFDPSGPLLAATMKKFKAHESAYHDEAARLQSVLNELDLVELRHPCSYLMEAADDIAYIAADLADYLKYFVDHGQFQEFLGHPDIAALAGVPALDTNFNELPTSLFTELSKVFTPQKSNEQITKFTSDLIKCLIKIVCQNLTHILDSFQSTDLNLVPGKMKEFSEKHSCNNDVNLLYSSSSSHGKALYDLKKQSYKAFILELPQIGSQNLLAKKVLSELFARFEDLIHSDFRKTDTFKMMPYDFKGFLLSAHDRKVESSPARVVFDFLSGMTDQYAVSLWQSISQPHIVSRAS